MQARLNLELLNRNMVPELPEPGEDVNTYIQVSKEAINTPAKMSYIQKLNELYLATRGEAGMEEMGVPDATNSAMAMNIVTA